jgi:F0F1-type ATP synthase assembly protein I
MTRDKKRDLWSVVGRYSSISMLLPTSAVVGYLIGYGLDWLFSTQFLRVVFLILGVAAGLVQVVRELTRDNE